MPSNACLATGAAFSLLIQSSATSKQMAEWVKAPTLIVHGTKDAVVPIRFGEKLFGLANPPKDFWRVEGAAHLAMGERLAETLDWIARTVG